MKNLFYTLAIVFPVLVIGQTTTENYIKNTTYRGAFIESTKNNATDDEIIESISYFDGLGRPIQVVNERAGGLEEDIITHIEYDVYGRRIKEYLPYALANNNGVFKTDALTVTNNFYNTLKYENTTNPYSEKLFDDSPLNRTVMQGAPGNDWKLGNNHEIKFDYQTNAAIKVKKYGVTLNFSNKTYTPILTGGGSYYGVGELSKTITKDENWTNETNHTTEEFKDGQGRVILKRNYANVSGGSTQHDTYYVYDDYGNLTYVLPPKVVHDSSISSTELSELCYQYKYDNRNRLVEKKIPGKGWEYIVYDKLDRPVLTQDAVQRLSNKWLFTKYDAFGRVAYTGEMTRTIIRITLQGYVTGTTSQYVTKQSSSTSIDGTTIYYNNGAYPTGYITDIHTINYYDNYTFDKASSLNLPSTSESQAIINYNNASGTQKLTKSLATGSKVRVLNSNPVKWITTVSGYDVKGRPIYVASDNGYLQTTDIVKSKLDFVGKVTKTTTTHAKVGKSTITIVDNFIYDDMGRLKTQKNKINSLAEETIVNNVYDDLGQLITKGVGGKTSNSNRLQDVDYTYNIRGWLKQINNTASLGNDLFSFKLNYNTVNNSGTPLFNGNISETEWKTKNSDQGLKWYRYNYDALNRITSGIDNTTNQDYKLQSIAYDKNGNITSLIRRGHTVANPVAGNSSHFGIMDNLVYTYEPNSNRLKKVLDNENDTYGFKDGSNITTEYTYDQNGNMLRDYNKGISSNISYNHLNLPTSVNVGGGNISYIYDATGVKLKKIVSTGATTEYAGNYVYEGSSLKFFNHPEGYVDAVGGYKYVYQYKDHLGNIRLSYKDSNNDGEITGASTQVFFDDFEDSVQGVDWNGSGHTWGWDVDEFDGNFKFSGNKSARLDTHSHSENVAHSNEWIQIDNAVTTNYIYSGWVFLENVSGNQADIFLFMNEPNETGYFTLIDSQTTYTKGTWVYLEKQVSVPSNIKKLNLRIDNDHAGKVWFDNVSIRKVNDPSVVEILEENNYYPFGLKHKGYNNNPTSSNIALKKTYNGKEFQDELGLNWHDYGARNYDATLGRWMNLDPLAFKYFSVTPYSFAGNNPLVFVDPNGKELILAGNRREKRQQFRQIKKLTGDKLKLNGKTGMVTVRKKGNSLSNGTKLISNIIGSKSTVTGYTSSGFKKEFGLELKGNAAIDGSNPNNASLGIGEGNAIIVFDPEDKGENIKNSDGTTGRPKQIGVAHELIHAGRMINGIMIDDTEFSNDYIDPDNPTLGPGGNPLQFHDEEMEVRGLEQLIRDEQKVIRRAEPKYVDPYKNLLQEIKIINGKKN